MRFIRRHTDLLVKRQAGSYYYKLSSRLGSNTSGQESVGKTMLRLVGTDGDRLYSFVLEPGTHQVGRSGDLSFCIPDKTISRTHAVVEVSASGEEVFVTDAGSHNGTTVNGVRISKRRRLNVGDTVQFGRIEFRVRDDDQSEAGSSRRTTAVLTEHDVEKSMVLSVNEALQALPSRVTERPELFPTLSEMARMLVLAEPRETMLERSLALVNKVIPAERLAVLMVEEGSEEIYSAATLLPSGKDPGSFTLSKTIIQEIMTNRSAILIGDPESDPRFASQQSIIMAELRSAMAVPLFDENEVLGILYVDTSNPLHRYNDQYLSLLVTFGNIIASRLLNYTLLYERQERQVYEAELRRASGIQKKLLISEIPDIPGYEVGALQQQCRAVGGDLYDIATLPDSRLVVIVADVSGKGMGAALLMSNILASFRILYNVTEFSLADVVNMVSHQLFCSSGAADFATLFVGVIDPATNRLSYINAGHNPPILVRADGRHEYLEASGTMIGAFDVGTWTQAETDLAPDDMLVVFTDGVTEADRGDQQYSEERLERLLFESKHQSPQQLMQTIMEDIDGFLEDAPRSDDITMLAVRRTK